MLCNTKTVYGVSMTTLQVRLRVVYGLARGRVCLAIGSATHMYTLKHVHTHAHAH